MNKMDIPIQGFEKKVLLFRGDVHKLLRLATFWSLKITIYPRVPNKRGDIVIVLALENQKNNRPKTKNYITEYHKNIQIQEVDPPPPFIRNKRVLPRLTASVVLISHKKCPNRHTCIVNGKHN